MELLFEIIEIDMNYNDFMIQKGYPTKYDIASVHVRSHSFDLWKTRHPLIEKCIVEDQKGRMISHEEII